MKVLPRNQILVGNARLALADLLPESVDCVVTSPPYPAGLRDYGHPDQLGREAEIEAYVGSLMEVMRGVHEVLKPAGSLWRNLGDAFARHPRQGTPAKSLLLAPERIVLAMAAGGWLVRGRVVWAKPNPLPESAQDRLSRTWEIVYHLTKQPCYHFDLDAIREPHRTELRIERPNELARRYQGGNSGLAALKARGIVGNPRGKNPGDVWRIATAVDPSGHQATFPEALLQRAVLATCPEQICVQCDQPWIRPTRWLSVQTAEGDRQIRKVGELARCDCFAPSRRGVVLDPFFGTGTVGVVAERLGRDWLGIELNPTYARLAEHRVGTARAA